MAEQFWLSFSKLFPLSDITHDPAYRLYDRPAYGAFTDQVTELCPISTVPRFLAEGEVVSHPRAPPQISHVSVSLSFIPDKLIDHPLVNAPEFGPIVVEVGGATPRLSKHVEIPGQ